ncbi:MAG: hypothetical protein ACM3SY_18925 [Candidatus Omnitrophota bacterium]
MVKKNTYKRGVFVAALWILLAIYSYYSYADDFFKLKEAIIREAWIKAHSFYFSPAVFITNLGYCSNIYAYDSAKQPDWTADIGANLEAALILKNRLMFKVNDRPYYSYYVTKKNERAFNNRLAFAFHTYLGRLNLAYRFNADHLRERPDVEFGAKTRLNSQSHELSLDYGRFRNALITLSAGLERVNYTDESYLNKYNLSLLNREEKRIGIGFTRRIFTRTTLLGEGNYYACRFPNDPQRNGTGKRGDIGIIFPTMGRITGKVTVGVKSFSPDNSLFHSRTQLVGSGTASIRLLSRFRLRFDYLADFFFSYWGNHESVYVRSLSPGLEYRFNDGIKIDARYQIGRVWFQTVEADAVTRTDDLHSIILTATARLFKKTILSLSCVHNRVTSTAAEFNQRYTWVGGSIVHGF